MSSISTESLESYSDEGLLQLHGELRQALAEDDDLRTDTKCYGCRQHPDFREQANAIEALLDNRSIAFTPLTW